MGHKTARVSPCERRQWWPQEMPGGMHACMHACAQAGGALAHDLFCVAGNDGVGEEGCDCEIVDLHIHHAIQDNLQAAAEAALWAARQARAATGRRSACTGARNISHQGSCMSTGMMWTYRPGMVGRGALPTAHAC